MTRMHQSFLPKDHVYRNLTIALTLLFVSFPVLDRLSGSSRIDSYLIAGFLIFALYQITRRGSDLVIGLALGIPAVASGIFNAATPDTPTINAIPTILGAAFLGFLVWRIFKDVFSGNRITSEQIFGSVCAYLLIGLMFSSVYGFIFLVNPDAFAFSDSLVQLSDHRAREPEFRRIHLLQLCHHDESRLWRHGPRLGDGPHLRLGPGRPRPTLSGDHRRRPCRDPHLEKSELRRGARDSILDTRCWMLAHRSHRRTQVSSQY